MLTDISAFCADNSFPETKAALDVALKAFAADVELNQMRSNLVHLLDVPIVRSRSSFSSLDETDQRASGPNFEKIESKAGFKNSLEGHGSFTQSPDRT